MLRFFPKKIVTELLSWDLSDELWDVSLPILLFEQFKSMISKFYLDDKIEGHTIYDVTTG